MPRLSDAQIRTGGCAIADTSNPQTVFNGQPTPQPPMPENRPSTPSMRALAVVTVAAVVLTGAPRGWKSHLTRSKGELYTQITAARRDGGARAVVSALEQIPAASASEPATRTRSKRNPVACQRILELEKREKTT